MARRFFDRQQFNFEFQFALGGVHYGAGDLGEMLSTADRIVDGDAQLVSRVDRYWPTCGGISGGMRTIRIPGERPCGVPKTLVTGPSCSVAPT
jgi:hypothetical protein